MSGIRLGDVVEHVIGGGWGADEAAEDRIPVRVIRGADFPEVERQSLEGVPLRFEDARKVPTRTLRVGDIVLEISGGTADRPTGRTVLVTPRLLEGSELPLIPASFCRLLRTDPTRVIGPFAYYALRLLYLQGGTWLFQNRSTGISNLQYPLLAERYHLPDFALPTQRAIAEVLGALDDKIAANSKVEHSAHSAALGLFRATQGSGQTDGVLGDLLDLKYGKALPANQRRSGDVVVYGSGGQSGTHDSALCLGPGIVVGRKGTAGSVYWVDADFYPIDTTYFVEPRGGEPLEYLYFVLRSLPLGELNSDSAVPGLNRVEALAQRVRHVDPDTMRSFANEAARLLGRVAAARDESRHLATLRDTLLPHLMSGRISVREGEQAVSEAL